MPQLDPCPWFSILIFSWLTLLAMVPLKVTAHLFPHEPTPQAIHIPKVKSWDWPWL